MNAVSNTRMPRQISIMKKCSRGPKFSIALTESCVNRITVTNIRGNKIPAIMTESATIFLLLPRLFK